MSRLALSLALVIAVLPVSLMRADDPGRVRVIDGDTIAIADRTIRLFGIDAVEHDQTCRDSAGRDWDCAAWSAAQLTALLDGQSPDCHERDIDRYGRSVAQCHAGGQDIGRAMVQAGAALAYRSFSDLYVADEEAARAAGRGLWSGTFDRPDAWRARDVDPAATGCDIKGNLSDSGRIYHLPGSRSYAATRIDTARGERWFCSVAEAEAAGWRAPQG